MHEEMINTIDELFGEAIMSEIPLVIVEGFDDISFYETIASKYEKDIQVLAIENIEGYSEGCDDVIKAIEDLQELILQKESNKKYILGIIDRDSRFYRNLVPDITSLFILRYYSYESHLANRYTLINILPIITNISPKMIDEGVLKYIETNIDIEYEKLFYFSLEALKCACIKNYDSVIRYSDKPGKLFAKDNVDILYSKIFEKKESLEEFANEYRITLDDIKSICKGKWILHVYANIVLTNIRLLSNACKNGEISQCQYCKAGKHDKCLGKLRNSINLGQIIDLFYSMYYDGEIGYIGERISLLA